MNIEYYVKIDQRIVYFTMNRLLTTTMNLRYWLLLLQILALDRVYTSGELNKSCVTDEKSCSECCVDHTCFIGGNFSNECRYGCIDGHRGARCYELCTYKCKNCDNDNDICESCYDGFYPGVNKDCQSKCLPTCKECSSGTSCTSCKEGFYNKEGSTNCIYPLCPENCVCNYTDCVACKPGFYFRNKSCTKCPNNCLECSSDSQCSTCQNGFFNDKGQSNNCASSCRDNCSICLSYDVCLQCQPGKFGKQCQNHCSVGCRYNVCDIETGKCSCRNNFSGENCTECVSGKFGVSCDRICPYNCNNAICGKTHGKCTKGCKSDTMTGTYCENCVVGKYGISCDDICPEKCLNRACDKENGICTDGCQEGYKGLFCFGCVNGKYGIDCKDDCPERCKDNECEKQSGHCFNCTGIFDGNMCDICKPGFYGSGCDRLCSSKCVNTTCDKDSGNCTHGCQDNYSGDKCCVSSEDCLLCESNTICRECSPGYFGQTCDQTCSDICINNICEMNNGICTKGCTTSSNNIICLRNQVLGKTHDDTKYDFKDILIPVLAVTTFALCTYILVMKIKKCLFTRRSHEESMVLNNIESSGTEKQSMSNTDEIVGKGNVPYERLGGDRLVYDDIDDHKYVSANDDEMTNKDTVEFETYVNLHI